MKQTIVLLLALLLAGCGRAPTGLYQSVGSEDKFRMILEIGSGGQAKFTTPSNLGNVELDRAVESSMSLDNARWTKDGGNVLVTGAAKDGKSVTYRFASRRAET
ncbi:MAG: hypothetical protein ACREH8_21450 [Opitutaceae bacterium]